MRLLEIPSESVGEIPWLLHRVVATINNRIIKEWVVLGNIHTGMDSTGTARKCVEIVGMQWFLSRAAEQAICRVISLNNIAIMEGDEPLYPAEATLSAEPMEFAMGIEEIKCHSSNKPLRHLIAKMLEELRIRIPDPADSNLPEWEREAKKYI